jgi:polyether ionophore transport system permease protein
MARADTAGGALTRQFLRDARTRTIVFACFFGIYSYIQPVSYRHAYRTIESRTAFANSFGNNKGLRLFYGEPHNLLTVGGYTAWRVGGVLAIAAAAFGLLAAVRALRSEEDAGRTELVLAQPVGRRVLFLSAAAAVTAGAAILWLAEFAGFVLGGLPAASSAYLALATASVVPVFAGLGALASQVAPTKRIALEVGSALLGVALLLRAAADTSAGAGWLRWTTPLGWAEELRPFAGARPLVLLLPLAASVPLFAGAVSLAARRDVGSGLLPARDTAEPRLRLLGSPTAQALRSERGSLLAWSGGVAVFGFVLGIVSASVSSAGISESLQEEIAKLGSGSIVTPTGYLAFVFFFFVLAVSLFVCAQVGTARHEEADQRLETLLALPVGRERWLGGRLAVAAAAAAAISLVAALLTWLGAVAGGVGVSVGRMLEAGANCIPSALLFLGIAALAYAAAPRASAAIAYGIVTAAFLWQTFGSLLGAPHWLVQLTPFAHVGLVPAAPFRPGAAAAMTAIGLAASAASLGVFRRRDLLGA